MTRAAYASYLHESPEDLAVKRTAWQGTKKRLLFFARKFAEAYEPGEPVPNGKQQGIMNSAHERENFPKGVIKKAGNLVRRIEAEDDPEQRNVLETALRKCQRDFAEKIGLGQAFS